MTEEQHKEALTATFSEVESIGYNDLVKALRLGYATIGCVYGESKVEKLKKFLENKGMILKDVNRKYSFNPTFYY